MKPLEAAGYGFKSIETLKDGVSELADLLDVLYPQKWV